jgi:hypothetical protein
MSAVALRVRSGRLGLKSFLRVGKKKTLESRYSIVFFFFLIENFLTLALLTQP